MSHDTWFWVETIALWHPLKAALAFVWGVDDPMRLWLPKRLFVLLPFAAVVIGYWTSLLSLPTLVVRAERRSFVSALLVTWWDLARATFSFWGGVLRFVVQLGISIFGGLQMLVVGVWAVLQELVVLPLRFARNLGSNVLNPGVPWIAVGLTFFWCVFEALIFTYVTTPLVIDTLSNLAGTQLSETTIRIPLFLFMLFIALGSYSVLSTWTAALKSRDWGAIAKIGVIEAVALTVEVVFLYREFVDALVPWFAQHASGKFELGILGTLAIAGMTWLGIRSLSWFLFAAAGTPTIMAIIQGQGLAHRSRADHSARFDFRLFSDGFAAQLRRESEWAQEQGERLANAFLVPPMQVVAAAMNFLTLLTANRHLFDLPLQSIKDFKDARSLMRDLNEPRKKRAA